MTVIVAYANLFAWREKHVGMSQHDHKGTFFELAQLGWLALLGPLRRGAVDLPLDRSVMEEHGRVALHGWVFAPGVLAGCSRSGDLAVLHRGEGECARALVEHFWWTSQGAVRLVTAFGGGERENVGYSWAGHRETHRPTLSLL